MHAHNVTKRRDRTKHRNKPQVKCTVSKAWTGLVNGMKAAAKALKDILAKIGEGIGRLWCERVRVCAFCMCMHVRSPICAPICEDLSICMQNICMRGYLFRVHSCTD